jgi:hypothetical protein
MSDAHKVKEFLLEWLFKFGCNPVRRDVIWDLHDYGAIEPHVKWCIKQGYINETRGLLDGRFSHALTDEGLNFLNKGENNEQ